MNRWEELADRLGIVEPHDERCQGKELCREHFIEKLREAGIDGKIVYHLVYAVAGRLEPGAKLAARPHEKPPSKVTIFGLRDGERVIVEWQRIGTAALDHRSSR